MKNSKPVHPLKPQGNWRYDGRYHEYEYVLLNLSKYQFLWCLPHHFEIHLRTASPHLPIDTEHVPAARQTCQESLAKADKSPEKMMLYQLENSYVPVIALRVSILVRRQKPLNLRTAHGPEHLPSRLPNPPNPGP